MRRKTSVWLYFNNLKQNETDLNYMNEGESKLSLNNLNAEEKSGKADSPPNASMSFVRSASTFSERMGDAGYLTGRRYDAVKNAFLSYRFPEGKKREVRSRIARGGETFFAGRKILGKLCLVGGYLRLFLALEPGEYEVNRFHHKDYSEVSRYKKFPLMIKLSSGRQVKNALYLISEVMKSCGLEPDPDYVAVDRADIFKKSARKMRARGAECETLSASTIPLAMRDETALTAAESEEFDKESDEGTEDFDGHQTDKTASGHEEISDNLQENSFFTESIDVALPRRAVVVNKHGDVIGKVRKGVWYDKENSEEGTFVKEDKNVFVYRGENRAGFLDKNYNVLTLSGGYVATVRIFDRLWMVVIALLLAFVTALTFAICAARTESSENAIADYAPVLFVADEKGTEWAETESLSVFYNDEFGDTVVVPGMYGSYRFVFENRNDNALEYSLTFGENNDFGLKMAYRLKRDGAYISGVSDYVEPDALGQDSLTIEARSSTVFELEWHWADNDFADTAAGEEGAVYVLTILFSAHISVSAA